MRRADIGDRALTRVAWTAWAVVVSLSLVNAVFHALNGSRGWAHEYGYPGAGIVTGLGITSAGVVVAARRQRNPIGWLFIAGGAALAVTYAAQQFSIYTNFVAPGSLPGGRLAAWLASWTNVLMLPLMIVYVPLLFPEGRLPSRRWRIPARLLVMTSTAFVVVAAIPTGISRIQPDGTAFGQASDASSGPLAGLVALLALITVAAGFAAIVSLMLRFRKSQRDERQQLKWFLFAGALLAVAFSLVAFGGGGSSSLPDTLIPAFFVLSLLGIPIATGVAILRYRLYDIDVVISRTLVYGSLAVFITAVYVGIAVGIGALIGGGGKPNLGLSILATAIVAVGFQPVRERVQRVANRLVYGKRATPYEVLSQFSGRVSESYAADDVMPRMARVLAEGTGAQRADVWLCNGAVWRQVAVWPADSAPAEPIVVIDGTLQSVSGANRLVEVRHQGDLLGALGVTKRSGESLTPVEENLLTHLAGQAGLVLKNVGLTADLQARLDDLRASRQRLVTAQDEERRRLERNLHDGAQQHLVALKVKLGLVEILMTRDPEKARATIEQLKVDADEALETLRDLARGIYPPLLADKGLGAALESHGRKATVPVTVEADGIGRYSQDVEAAIYFSVLEALQNVQKYAQASRAVVRLRDEGGGLGFEVEDDGVGFDVATTKKGAGLTNMTDRVDALGGKVGVTSVPGRGTRLHGWLQAASTSGRDRGSAGAYKER